MIECIFMLVLVCVEVTKTTILTHLQIIS